MLGCFLDHLKAEYIYVVLVFGIPKPAISLYVIIVSISSLGMN